MDDLEKFQERSQPKELAPIKYDSQQNSFLATIERLASRPDIDPDKIKQFMDMQERILNRNAKQSFNAAMTRTQNKIQLVVAKHDNVQAKSKYAKLKDILIEAKPIYTAEGFSLMFYEGDTTKDKHMRIMVDIMHQEGHTETRHGDFAVQTTGIAGSAMMTLIHGQGSAISYGRRYLTCMIFNIPTGDDDDGNKAGGGAIKYINEKQLSTIVDLINAKKIDQTKFCKWLKVETPKEILAKDFGKAVKALEAKK